MAVTSAWAVGSHPGTTRFVPVAITRPSRTITAPNGPPPFLTFSIDRSIACRMYRSRPSFAARLVFSFSSMVEAVG